MQVNSWFRRRSIAGAAAIAIGSGCGGESFTDPYIDPCPPGAEVSPATLKLKDAAVTVRVGELVQTTVSTLNASGIEITCTLPFVWTTSDAAVANVGILVFSSAAIIGVGKGSAWVAVRSGTASDSVRVTVTAPTG